MKRFTTLMVLSSLLTSASALPLLEDNFTGPEVNTNLWEEILPFSQSHVTQTNGWLTAIGRGSLATKAGFDVPLILSGRMTLNSGSENCEVKLRSDLSTNTSPYYGPYYEMTGVQVVFSADNNRVYIHEIGVTNSVIPELASTAFVFQVGQAYDFTITDDKTNVTVSIDGTNVVSAATSFATGNRIAFQSREWPSTSTSLDFITIAELSSSEPTPAPAGLVAWWRAEGDATDQLGNHDGTTPFGMAFADGEVGSAFDFNGSSRRVSVPDSPEFQLTNAITIEGWVYPRSYGGFICFRGDNRPGLDAWTLDANREGYVTFSFGTVSNDAVGLLAPLQLNEWQHVAATWDRTTRDVKIYINGTLAAQAWTTLVPIGELDPSEQPAVGIGNHGGTFHQFPFNGLIDELSIYSSALTSAEIQAIYEAGSAGKVVPVPPVITDFSGSQTVVAGDTVTFSVTATGTSPLAYQWQFNGDNLAGATNSSLLLSDVQLADAGTYSVTVANAAGSVTSSNAVLTVTAPTPTPAPAGLVAWWKAESNATDIISGNNGVAVGALGYAAGQVGQAFMLDGSTSYIPLPATPSLNIGTGNGITIECWAQPGASTVNGWGAPIIEWDSATTDGLQLWFGSGYLFANVKDTSGVSHTLQSVAGLFATNKVQHVAFTYDKNSGDALLYLDAKVVASTNFGSLTPQTTYPVNIGRRTGQPVGRNQTYGGLIDELSLYNRALGSNEIAAIYQAGSAGKFVPPPVLAEFDAATAFSTNSNPNGAWSYGYSTTLGGEFNLHQSRGVLAGLDYWRTDLYGNVPGAFHNGSNVAVTYLTYIVAPNQLMLHPGNAGEFSILRFTAPQSGTYRVQASFVGVDTAGTTTDAHVLLPTGSIWDAPINGYGASSAKAFDSTVALNSGDQVDFAVGKGGNDFYYDSTGVAVLIDLITNAPPVITNTPPVIADFAPKFGTSGTVVILTGTSFSPVAASNVVYFGAVRATVTAASPTNLTVTVPVGATYAPPAVTVDGVTGAASTQFTPTFAGGGAIVSSNFAPRVNLPTTGGGMQTVMADLDGDGKSDIAVVSPISHLITLYRNVSTNGTLAPSSFVAAGQLTTFGGGGPIVGLAADADGDGRLDLLLADRGNNLVSVYLNQGAPGTLGTNSFAPRMDFTVGAFPRDLAVGDLDRDGRLDIVTINQHAGTVSVLQGTGSPGQLSFAAKVDFAVATSGGGIAVTDLDGDGKLDILASSDSASSELCLLRNTSAAGIIATNSFAPEVRFALPPRAQTVRAGDVDGDGKPDVLVSSFDGFSLSVFRNISTPGALGTNSLAPRVDFALGARAHSISMGDLNGDAKPDVVVDCEMPSRICVFQNASTPGSFTNSSFAPRVDLVSGNNAWGSTVGDLDGDGRADILCANYSEGTVSIYRNVSEIILPPPPEPVEAPAGLVAWWRAESNALDSVGTNHGTAVGGVSYAAGKVGQSFKFDALDEKVVAPTTGLPTGTSDRTMECWVYLDSLGESLFVGYGNYGASGQVYHLGAYADHRLFFSQWGQSLFGPVLTTNRWYHVAVTSVGTNLTLYLDGTNVASGALSFNTPSGSSLYIGGVSAPYNPRKMLGLIDEVSVYNRALSSNEIAAIYQAGSAGKVVPPIPPAGSAPIIEAIQIGDSGSAELKISGPIGGGFVVETSTNLVDWAPVGDAIECGGGKYKFNSGPAPSEQRFFRVATP